MAIGNAGGLFVGALKMEDKSFLKPLLENARKNGYERFVEPCAGALAMSYLAVGAGWKTNQIEASDISFFSGIYGRAVNGKDTADMKIQAMGFTETEMLDPATALYAQMYLRMTQKAGKTYFYELLRDLKLRRQEHINTIQEQINIIKGQLNGINYQDMCMWKHIREIKNDKKTIAVLCPPTYTAGYEKFFDTGGKLQWQEPEFEVFNPETGLKDLYDEISDAKALFIVYEERKIGESVGVPVYGRDAGRKGMYMYLTSNRPDEAAALAYGKEIVRKSGQIMRPLKRTILPKRYEINEKSQIGISEIKSENATYYRKLWTHNFDGGASGNCMAMFIDGYIAGIFGYDKVTIALMGKSDIVFKFGITAPADHRLNRLLYMIASSRQIVNSVLDDIQQERVNGVVTTMITKYPESKEMRGIMKLVERVKDKTCGFKLKYRCDIKDMTIDDILAEWLRKERKWLENRAKIMK